MADKILALLKLELFNTPEDEITFESFTRFSLLLFRTLWFNFKPLQSDASLKEKFKFHAKVNYNRVCLFCFVIDSLFIMVHAFIDADNFESATIALTNSLFAVLICLKGFVTLIRKDDIWNIFRDLRSLQERRVGLNQKYGIKKFLDEYHFYMKIYTIPNAAVLLPIVFSGYLYLRFGTMQMIATDWFPIAFYHHNVFPFALLFVEWTCFNIVAMLLSTDSMTCALITVIVTEFHVFEVDLMDIKSVPKPERVKQIRELTDRHNKLLDLCDKIQEIYSLTFFFTIFISSLIICSALFQLAFVDNSSLDNLFYVSYMCLIGGQTLLQCLYGQKLIDASESVANGVYDCGWEDFSDNTFTKQLVLMILRGQKAKRFTALSFASICLESFTKVKFINIFSTSLTFSFYSLRYSLQALHTFLYSEILILKISKCFIWN